ncbi:MAG: serine/threonine protein kinase [Candidatus Binataceae bacterium]
MHDPAQLCMGCMNDRGGAAVCPVCGFDEARAPALPLQLAPRTLLNDQYIVGRALGAGGFAITYLAWDTRLARRVAIKEYMPAGLASRAGQTSQVVPHTGQARQDFNYGLERFLDEARMVAQFQEHPGIISVTNFFPANGTAYLVMEYLEGATLKEYLAQQGGRLGFNAALAVMTPVMDALRELHRADVLHRDISPDNIYVTNGGQVKLLDFGAARQALRDRSQRLSVILKVGYAPEEQYRSAGKQGPWTDVYAAGATFYHLITGTIPPPSIDRLAEDTIQPPSALGAEIPQGGERALMTALAVKAAQRYPTIQDFQAAIGLPSSTAPQRRALRTVRLPDALPPWTKPALAAAGLVVICVIGFMVARYRIAKAPLQTSGSPNIPGAVKARLAPSYNYAAGQWQGVQAAHAGEIAPLKDSWPPNDLDVIAQKALTRARKWAADAELVSIHVALDDKPGQFYIQSKAGTITINLNFYSPSKQQAISITPNSPNNPGQTDGDIYSMGYVDWSGKQPIPGKFLSLDDAIKQAQLEGMRAPAVKSADLSNYPPGTMQGGMNMSGLKWFLQPVFGFRAYAISAQMSDNRGMAGRG